MLTKRTVAALVCTFACLVAPPAHAESLNNRNGIRQVLLLSIDGMHALDYENCVTAGTCPALAALGKTGVTYIRTSMSRPSDSFLGLMVLVIGGTPRTVGAFYDVAYDRVLAPPLNDTGNGVSAGLCNPGQPNGTTTEYEEGVDLDQTKLNGGAPGAGLTDGGIRSIDTTRLPRDPFNNCLPVYPWNFVRTNTIDCVIHAADGYTAWSDNHSVYAAVSGPTGTAMPSNVDDYYSPEINSQVIALSGVHTPAIPTNPTGSPCSPVRDTAQTGSWTDSFKNVQCYDTLKVNAILNEIDGKAHDGMHKAPVPTLFGMNFQAVSVGQKLIEKINDSTKIFGGYTDAAGTPSAALLDEIEFVDASIGQMVTALKQQGLFESTLIIITAKHGQSPIDPHRFKELGHGITTTPADVIAADLPFSESPANLSGIGPTQDDIALLWLTHTSDTLTAVILLEASADAAGIGQIFYGPSLETMFNPPGLPPHGDPRSPDIIVQPYVGVVYTSSAKKQAEHGGFAHDDTNVMLLVSNPAFAASTVTSFVETTQVAPTILLALGLDPGDLEAVQQEGTPVLPGLSFK